MDVSHSHRHRLIDGCRGCDLARRSPGSSRLREAIEHHPEALPAAPSAGPAGGHHTTTNRQATIDLLSEGSRPTSPRSGIHLAARSVPGSGRPSGPTRPPRVRLTQPGSAPRPARYAAPPASRGAPAPPPAERRPHHDHHPLHGQRPVPSRAEPVVLGDVGPVTLPAPPHPGHGTSMRPLVSSCRRTATGSAAPAKCPSVRAFDRIESWLRPSSMLITPPGVFAVARLRSCCTRSVVHATRLLRLRGSRCCSVGAWQGKQCDCRRFHSEEELQRHICSLPAVLLRRRPAPHEDLPTDMRHFAPGSAPRRPTCRCCRVRLWLAFAPHCAAELAAHGSLGTGCSAPVKRCQRQASVRSATSFSARPRMSSRRHIETTGDGPGLRRDVRLCHAGGRSGLMGSWVLPELVGSRGVATWVR